MREPIDVTTFKTDRDGTQGVLAKRQRKASLVLAALAVVAALTARPAVAGQAEVPVAPASASSPNALAGFLWPLSGERLTDQDGRLLTSSRLDDKVVAVTFFDTGCSAACAIRTLDLAAVAGSLGEEERSHLTLLAISLDPVRDKPAALAAFAAAMKLDTAAVTLLAGDAEVAQERMRLIRFRPVPGAPDSIPSTVFVFDRRGQMAMRYAGDPVDRRRLKADLATLTHLDRGVGASVSSSIPLVTLR